MYRLQIQENLYLKLVISFLLMQNLVHHAKNNNQTAKNPFETENVMEKHNKNTFPVNHTTQTGFSRFRLLHAFLTPKRYTDDIARKCPKSSRTGFLVMEFSAEENFIAVDEKAFIDFPVQWSKTNNDGLFEGDADVGLDGELYGNTFE